MEKFIMVVINKKLVIMQLISIVLTIILMIAIIPKLMNFTNYSNQITNTRVEMFIWSWVGIIISIFTILFWYQISGDLLNSYSVFYLFLMLFSFGQCLLWAFGIHIDNEIGSIRLFSNYQIPESVEIIKTQLYTCICMQMFSLGSLFCYKPKRYKTYSVDNTRIILFKITKWLSYLVVPLTFLKVIVSLNYSARYGYGSLYYSAFAESQFILILRLVEIYFFPCLVGQLIGSNYESKITKKVYFIMFLYTLLYFLAGERGNWLYKIIVLFWLHHRYVKKINLKKLLKVSVLVIFALYLINIVVNLRGIGINNVTFSDIQKSFSFSNFPLYTFISEMGNSMGVLLIVINSNFKWTYTNTFLVAILGMPTTSIPLLLGLDVRLASSVLSSEYLNIGWGTGFSLFSECYINFGLIGGLIFIALVGFFIASIIYIPPEANIKTRPLRIFYASVALEIFCGWPRSISLTPLRDWFRAPVLIVFIVALLSYNYRKSTGSLIKNTL